MTIRDRRSVGELLLDTDYLARLTLLDADAESALAMLRTWPEVVQSAAELWEAIPHREDLKIMQRLEAITQSMHRDQVRRGWPGNGPPDERLLQMSENLTHAADLVTGRWQVPRRPRSGPSSREAADVAAAQTRIVHSLWVGGHSVSVAIGEHAHDLRLLKQSKANPRVTRGIQRGKDAQDRLGAFESLAAAWLKDRWPGALRGEYRDQPDPSRLGKALSLWDIQVHRTLTATPTPANLWLATTTQTTIVDTATSLLRAGARQGTVDSQTASRLAPALQSNEHDWSHACGMWQELHSPVSARFDRALARSAAELRAAAKEITHDPISVAAPDDISSRIGLNRIGPLLGHILASNVELAHVIQAISASREPILAPNNNLAHIANDTLRRTGHRVESVEAFPVPLADTRVNPLSPIPHLIRNELVEAGAELIKSSNTAMAAGADLARGTPVAEHPLSATKPCAAAARNPHAKRTPLHVGPESHVSTGPSR